MGTRACGRAPPVRGRWAELQGVHARTRRGSRDAPVCRNGLQTARRRTRSWHRNARRSGWRDFAGGGKVRLLRPQALPEDWTLENRSSPHSPARRRPPTA